MEPRFRLLIEVIVLFFLLSFAPLVVALLALGASSMPLLTTSSICVSALLTRLIVVVETRRVCIAAIATRIPGDIILHFERGVGQNVIRCCDSFEFFFVARLALT